jgi:hypothetical protein
MREFESAQIVLDFSSRLWVLSNARQVASCRQVVAQIHCSHFVWQLWKRDESAYHQTYIRLQNSNHSTISAFLCPFSDPGLPRSPISWERRVAAVARDAGSSWKLRWRLQSHGLNALSGWPGFRPGMARAEMWEMCFSTCFRWSN